MEKTRFHPSSAPEILSGAQGPNRRQLLAGFASSLAAAGLSGMPALAAADDLHFVHAFGEITLPQPAKRVVSLGYTTQDTLLALGVVPLAIRQWFGNQPYAVWPWARPLLGDAKPQLISGEVSPEIVASLQPDLIVAIGSGVSKAEYEVLSQIAPVLMQTSDQPSYGTTWDVLLTVIGRAVGMSDKADELIAGVHKKFADARERHPDWAGHTAVCAYNFGGESGAFIGSDTRATFVRELGFKAPEKLEVATKEGFYSRLSPEDLSALDADLLIWISSADAAPDIVALPMRKTLKAHLEGREVFAGAELAGALSFGSVLSLPFALDKLEAEIALALDGKPETQVPSSVAAGLAP
ncbi:ABC transporter substrate-binding protein [Neorhizobium alkalisoli]|uniref:Iron complex transport system substrate-binding protein n=1 Tax=Neorhizobium alkalisoli TaxID=528178 RepID=A0A561R6Q2_9HYPH|nr:ABC transporter substrate-binding protein [Neorhizobium alkalisoli]TWF58295.1 iron complex transport system substrate-binding protein [Neorhizobium alkalisoli]